LVLIALVVLAAFAGVVWLAYTQGVERGRASVSRELVAREVWTVRKSHVPPYTGLKIYEPPSAGSDRNAAAARPSAANTIPTLRPSANAVADNGPARTAAGKAKAAAPSPGVTAVLPGAVAPDLIRGSPAMRPGTAAVPGNSQMRTAMPAAAGNTEAAGKPQPQPVATRAPTELVKPAAAPPTHPLTSLDSLPPQQEQVAAIPAGTPPAQKQIAAIPASTPTATKAVVATPSTTAARQAMSGVVLQIGSYRSEAEARQSWNAFKSEHDAASGYQSDVKAVDLGGRGTWYRLRMGPFADRKSALQVCAKLKAGGASCLLAQ
jgi:cell division protein FtsN